MFKKFISILAALAVMIGAANAQTIENPGLFENISVTVDGGVIAPLKSENSFFQGIRGTSGLEISKYVTPVVGFSVESLAHFNTTGAYTIVDQSAVLGNLKFNISNLLANYKGYPRRVELVGVAGLGWGHDYGEPRIDPNYVVYNTGAEFNFNMGQKRAWQINVRPTVLWNNYDNNPKFNVNDAYMRLTVGLTYKFGNKSKKSHNFVVCPYAVTQADYDALKAQYDALVAKGPEIKEVVKETIVIKEVPVEKTRNVVAPMNVTFAMGSAQLSEVEKAKIEEFVQSTDVEEVLVVGSADKGTGTLKRNEYLAQERANVVAKFLEKLGIKAKVDTTLDVNENSAEASRAAIIDANAQ